ncbi:MULTISPECIES: hypothetical protein [unclassified Variovorax]|uniref:hypothetical protein n=1 Tax=unclassified Variovorax TaxID=663243 RepID=UPI0034E8DD3C
MADQRHHLTPSLSRRLSSSAPPGTPLRDAQHDSHQHSACAKPEASVASIALAHGLNANLVHKWRRMAAAPAVPKLGASAEPTYSFISLAVAVSQDPLPGRGIRETVRAKFAGCTRQGGQMSAQLVVEVRRSALGQRLLLLAHQVDVLTRQAFGTTTSPLHLPA